MLRPSMHPEQATVPAGEAMPQAARRRHMRLVLVRRLTRNAAIVTGLILAALFVGAAGYHYLNDLGWLDATLNAAMILTGMGPVDPLRSPSAKIFAIVYALASGVFFLTMVAVLLAPALQHVMHRLHLDLEDAKTTTKRH
jgi:hypothetical protein